MVGEHRKMASWEWLDERIVSTEDLTWDKAEKSFHSFCVNLQKLGFKPHKQTNYHCKYNSDIPSTRFEFRAKTKAGTDRVCLFTNIHNFEFELDLHGESFYSGPRASSSALEQPFRDFYLEVYPACQNLCSILGRKPNESKIIYGTRHTSRIALLNRGSQFQVRSKTRSMSALKMQQIRLWLTMLKIKRILNDMK